MNLSTHYYDICFKKLDITLSQMRNISDILFRLGVDHGHQCDRRTIRPTVVISIY